MEHISTHRAKKLGTRRTRQHTEFAKSFRRNYLSAPKGHRIFHPLQDHFLLYSHQSKKPLFSSELTAAAPPPAKFQEMKKKDTTIGYIQELCVAAFWSWKQKSNIIVSKGFTKSRLRYRFDHVRSLFTKDGKKRFPTTPHLLNAR